MIVDLFAGPGGWDQGAKMLGLSTVGLEWDHAACMTAVAAGHPRIECDVAAYPTAPFVGKTTGLIASPPCQAWSMAGKRKGEHDRAACHQLADRMATGDDSTDWTEWEDVRSALVCQPVRWVRDLRPEWVALEEVPAVASLWEHMARIFRSWGYSVWTGDLNAADYGLPQTRTRRILIGSRVGRVEPPEPTHSRDGDEGDLFGSSRAKWVSMSDVLGWGMTGRPYPAIACSRSTGGPDKEKVGGSGARAAIYAEKDAGRWVLRASNHAHASVRAEDQPAPTMLFAAASNDVRWYPEGHTAAGVAELADTRCDGSVRISQTEAAILQGFPADYPWQGTSSKRFQQIGNAVPPLLAAHVLSALTGEALEVAA